MEWYWGPIDREEAASMLAGEADGTFLVRESQSSKGSYSISVAREGSVSHVRIINKDKGLVNAPPPTTVHAHSTAAVPPVDPFPHNQIVGQ